MKNQKREEADQRAENQINDVDEKLEIITEKTEAKDKGIKAYRRESESSQ